MQSLHSFGMWKLIRSLGEGGFGEVHHWRNQFTEQEIATKSLKPNLRLKSDEIEVLKKRWLQEYNWMKSLDIPFIVSAIDIGDNDFLRYLQEQNHWKTLPVIAMEYCNGGDLRSVLHRVENTNGLAEKEVRNILHSLRHAVEYLHQRFNIEHRDIKPENIVINHSGEETNYKLTDFGYAREIPEQTIAQSVVGTRHYVAPEVIEPGCYTKTVDYWSVGVLAFEIICGIRPFIPHRDFRLILTNILEKPRKCIYITQFIDDPEADRFSFEEKIIRQNNCTPIFNNLIEKWLYLALDKDYKQRGIANGHLQFYTNLDAILKTEILSVYSISSCKFYYYDINTFKDMGMFYQKLSEDTKIPLHTMCIPLPTLHPKKSVNNIVRPREFYVSEWLDPNDSDNPPAMLYVASLAQCDFNVDTKAIFSTVPKVISVCLKLDNTERVPHWLLEQFERQVHYLLSEQQRHVECHMKALFEYIISVELEVFLYKPNIEKVHVDAIMLSGRVRQFVQTVQKYAEMTGVENPEFIEKAKMFLKDADILKEQVASNIVKRYNSVCSHCKDLSGKDIYKALPQKDIYKLKAFRCHLVEVHSHNLSNSLRMNECFKAFDTWTQELTNFSHNLEIREIHKSIYTQYDIFSKIKKTVYGIVLYVEDFEKKLDEGTLKLLQEVAAHNDNIAIQMNSLSIDGNRSNFSWPAATGCVMNVDSQLNGDAFGPSVSKLIEESNNLNLSIRSVMDIDDANAMCVEIPTTIQDL